MRSPSVKMQDAQGKGNSGDTDARRQPEVEEQGQANIQESQG
jgi:hypothetical protein